MEQMGLGFGREKTRESGQDKAVKGKRVNKSQDLEDMSSVSGRLA